MTKWSPMLVLEQRGQVGRVWPEEGLYPPQRVLLLV